VVLLLSWAITFSVGGMHTFVQTLRITHNNTISKKVLWRTDTNNKNSVNNSNINNNNVTRVAFVGNSMFYFNDSPRFFENLVAVSSTAISKTTPSQHQQHQQQQRQQSRKLIQNSCLHGGSSIPSLFYHGNGMYEQFRTEASILTRIRGHTIYDYGACTVPQLLSGNARFAMPPRSGDNTAAIHLNPCHNDMIYLQYAKQWFATQILVTTQLQQQKLQQQKLQAQQQQQQLQQQPLELE